MKQIKCDNCGKVLTRPDNGGDWKISIMFWSHWILAGNSREIDLCHECGFKAANNLGYCYDMGKILSISKGEQVDATGRVQITKPENPDAMIGKE